MTDREYARRFERGDVRNEDFHHKEHLRVAWAYLEEADTEDTACAWMRETIRGFAQANGHPEKFHETITVFWVRLLARVREAHPHARALEDVLGDHPHLLAKETLFQWYSRERVTGEAARMAWLEPDLRPLALHAPRTDPGDPPRDAPHRP